MFDKLEAAPPDAIFGLNEAFRNDPNPAKVNLTIGVYRNADGTTPILPSVKQAEAHLLESETSKSYLSIEGMADYAVAVQKLLFGPDHEIVASQRAVTAQTPGGTGALRVAAEFLKGMRPDARVWVSDPTWANHPNIFRAAGLAIGTYPYYDAASHGIALDAMLSAFGEIPEGDVVLLHGCCHNPTGVDPTPEEWRRIADVVQERSLLPLIDFAYQGFANGLREDAAGVLAMARPGAELLVASSFSKNLGLYNERLGAMTLVASEKVTAQVALTHIKRHIRANYSNPPFHGAGIVTHILADPKSRAMWQCEVDAMRDRINAMRRALVEGLAAKGVTRDFSFIERQRGMFSYSGLTREQVKALREKHAIYMLASGRINVAAITPANVGAICEAIADVL